MEKTEAQDSAFPGQQSIDNQNNKGVTKREYFAAIIFAQVAGANFSPEYTDFKTIQVYAQSSVIAADYLIKALNTQPITDANGCVLHSQDTAHVALAPHPAAVILANDTIICAGQTVAGIVYTWLAPATVDTVFVVSQAGTYTLIASDNGCTTTSTINITSTNPPTIELGPDQNLCSCDTTVTLDAGIPGTYLWSNGATTQTAGFTAMTLLSPGELIEIWN